MKEIKINQNIVLNIIIALISFFATCSVSYTINFENNITYTNSAISLVIFCAFVYLLKKILVKENEPKIKATFILGIIFATFLVLGNSIKTKGSVQYKDFMMYFAIFFISIIIDALLVWLYKLIERLEVKRGKEGNYKLDKDKRMLIIFSLIVICWTIVLLGVYPGYFCYDAPSQYEDYINGNINDWHPPIHTVFLGFIISTVSAITKSYNMGIFAYTFLQILITAACFTYCISFLEKQKISKIIRIISIIYYAIFPTVVMFVMCNTKDIFFSAVVIISMIMALEALQNKEKFLKSRGEQAKLILIIFLAIILRKNAIYAYIPFLIIFGLAFKNKKILIPIIGVVVSYLIYTILIYGIFKIENKRNVEAFSVPLQQIARVYNYNYENLTQEEIDTIHEFITDEQIKEYLPECSDPLKVIYLDEFGKGRFIKLWFQIGIKNIGTYIDSFLANTLGYWYPDTIVDGYNKRDPMLYSEETSYCEASCKVIGKTDSKIPWLNNIYYNLARYETMQKIPVISMLFSIRSNDLANVYKFRI